MRRVANRREFVAGAAVTAGALALPKNATTAKAAPVKLDARPDVVHRGRAIAVTSDGRLLVIAEAARRELTLIDRRTQRKQSIALPGQPLEVAIAHGNRIAAVSTAFWDKPGVTIVPLGGSGKPVTVDAGKAPCGVAFTPDGRHLLVSGGEQSGELGIHKGPDFKQAKTVSLGRVPRGLVATPDGKAAWVAVQGEDAVLRVDLRSGKVTRRIATAALPDRLAISRDGRRLLISHGGHDVHTITELDTRSGKAHKLDAAGRVNAVAFGRAGRRLATLTENGVVVAISAGGKRTRTRTVTGPRGLAVAGGHAFTVSSITGAPGRVRA